MCVIINVSVGAEASKGCWVGVADLATPADPDALGGASGGRDALYGVGREPVV